MAWRVVSKGVARSLTERPPAASWSSSWRRIGWASAPNTSASASATALRATVMQAVYMKAIPSASNVKVIGCIWSEATAEREVEVVALREVVVVCVPVSEQDRAKAFYDNAFGF